jgi:2-C-methyl-D-erythritol 2,4-cyclodiphosphate synthase
LAQAKWKVVNVDVTIFAEAPKLGRLKRQMAASLAELLGVSTEAVNVKAKTGEGVGAIGRGEAVGCQAVVLIDRAE